MWLTIVLLLIWPCHILAKPDIAISEVPKSTLFFVPPDALGQEKPRLPEKKIKPAPTPPKFVLPRLKKSPDQDQQLSGSLRVFIRRIELIGNTVFSKEELSELTQPYKNRTITSEELQALRHELSQYYIDRGYINSGAFIPDQKIGDGNLSIQIIEGKLSEIDVNGNEWLRSSYIDKRIARSNGLPLNTNTLQERLLLLQQDPLIKGISAELRPGMKAGESQLNIHVKEARPYQIGMEVSNVRSPSIGGFNGKVWLAHNNLTGFGDALYFAYGRTEGLDDYSASYSLPLNAYDTQLRFYYQNSRSSVVEKPFDELDIRSRSETYGVSLNQAFYKTPQQIFSMQVSFEHRRSKTFLLDEPFSFSPGVPDQGENTGESRISVSLNVNQPVAFS